MSTYGDYGSYGSYGSTGLDSLFGAAIGLLIFALIFTLVIFLYSGWYQSISDIWILFVSFVVGIVIAIVIFLLYIYVLSLFVNIFTCSIKEQKFNCVGWYFDFVIIFSN